MDLVDRVASRTPSHSSFTIFLLSPTVSGLLIDKNQCLLSPKAVAKFAKFAAQIDPDSKKSSDCVSPQWTSNRGVVAVLRNIDAGPAVEATNSSAVERCICSSLLSLSAACLQYSILQNYLGRYDLLRGRGDHDIAGRPAC